MLPQILWTRYKQKMRTMAYPDGDPPPMPPLFAGRPHVNGRACLYCGKCADACEFRALALTGGNLQIDLGRCAFCRDCEKECPARALTFTDDFRLAASRREQLKLDIPLGQNASENDEVRFPEDIKNELAAKFFRQSLTLRVVSAGGCNACEQDVNVLNTIGWDLSRFGIKYAASPRHADGLIVIGTVPPNMRSALLDTYAAVPTPKVVIAIGACAISGGLFSTDSINDADANDNVGVLPHLPVDLFIPGCPPHPLTILDGLLRFLGITPS